MYKLIVLPLILVILTGCGKDVPNENVTNHIKELCERNGGQLYVGYSESPLGMWQMEVGCVFPKKVAQ